MEDSKTTIKDLLDGQVIAIRKKDIAAAAANYAADVRIFDVVGPLQHKEGAPAVKHRLEQWFSGFKDGEDVGFEIVDLDITCDGNIGFSRGLNHIHAPLKNGGSLDMYWRETLNWKKQGDRWQIVHAHSSVPFDVNTGQGSTGLKP